MVIVPVRSFADAKSRLGSVLDADQRSRLARACAERVVKNIGPDRSVVVCNDEEVAHWSRSLGADTYQVSVTGLNRSLEAAVPGILAERHPDEIVIVHADLAFPGPLADLDSVVPPGTRSSVVIVPDRHRDGTNVLVLGCDLVPEWRFAYGPGSFRAHCEQAGSLGSPARVVDHPELGFDLDTPSDLEDHRVRDVIASLIPEWIAPIDRHLRAVTDGE